ncbi:MAG: NADP-dependent isocitrate dehydrogenase, partial [Gammaproteobacteria bacterium]
MKQKIIYTITDEAPALASASLLPIIEAFAGATDVSVETRDISLAGRIIAAFPENLSDTQKQHDALAELGQLTQAADANIIKLPNISASIPQLNAAIRELQEQGYQLPDYPEEPANDAEQATRDRYAKILGSAVNPVLREGNSDRRVAGPVKEFAKQNPHSMGAWNKDSKSHVAHMSADDFYGSEQSAVIAQAGDVKIEFLADDGQTSVLKESTPVQQDEVIDAAVMSCKALRAFFAKEIQDAKDQGVLLSLHLKATMMKVSDPIMFGHAVTVFFAEVFEKHAATFEKLGVDANNGLGDVYTKIAALPDAERTTIEADLAAAYADRPELAMVDSD